MSSVCDVKEADYSIRDLSNVMTPALAIYADMVEHNIDRTIALLDGDPARWRPHLKTTKSAYVMRMLTSRGVTAVKCATTLELLRACESGASDVLLAMPVLGANAKRALQIASTFPQVEISVLIDSEQQLPQWVGTKIGVFIDIDSGMRRTGIPVDAAEKILELAQAVRKRGIRFRGLHSYEGHLRDDDLDARIERAHAGYDHLMNVIQMLERNAIPVQEVVTSGTPAFPCALAYLGFRGAAFVHRASPGTVVYGDLTSAEQLPANYGYKLAALVLSRVISHSGSGQFTCDAGHKAISADSGIPNSAVLGWEGLTPLHPSEEHLPVSSPPGLQAPLGEILYLAPKHVCPTVNNFTYALLVKDREIISVEAVSARGHEFPLWSPA